MEEDWLEELARRKREGIAPPRRSAAQAPKRRIEPGLDQRRLKNRPDPDDLPHVRAEAKRPATESEEPPTPRQQPPQAPPAAAKPEAAPRPEKKRLINKPEKRAPRETKPSKGDKADESMLLVLFIAAPQGKRLNGMDIFAAARQVNLQPGPMDVFYLYDDLHNKQNPVFTMASILEPGSFAMDSLEQFETPGLALFCQLPTHISGSAAFERMLAVGRHMAQALNAELKDESRSTLTLQTIGHIREKVKDFDFRHQHHH